MRNLKISSACPEMHFALRHKPAPILFAALLALSIVPLSCWQGSLPPSFSFRRGKISAWDNAEEGFSLVLSEIDGQTQGFLAWERKNLYGRIGTASRGPGKLELTLADGGMNGAKLTARVVRGSLEFEDKASARVIAKPRAHRLWLMGGTYPSGSARGPAGVSTAGKEVPLAMRLQYLSSKNGKEAALLDLVLRRGADPSRHAADRLVQQSEAVRANADDALRNSQRPPFTREYEEIEYPVFISDRYLCAATSHYLFEGGAHGNAATSFDVIDLVQGRRLSMNDVLQPERQYELGPHIERALFRQFEALGRVPRGQANDLRSYGLFESVLPAPNDFFICKAGLCVQYDRYDIAPWAEGEFIILIPWEEIKDLLTQDFVLP